jgi:hypothetical protein
MPSHRVLQEAIYIANCLDWQDKYLAGLQEQGQAADNNNFYFYFFCRCSFKVALYPENKAVINKNITKGEEVSHQFFT